MQNFFKRLSEENVKLFKAIFTFAENFKENISIRFLGFRLKWSVAEI